MDGHMTPKDILSSYETREAELIPDPSEAELGQKNSDRDIRTIITNQKLRGVGLKVVGKVRGVRYGLWNDRRACLLAMHFDFRLADRQPDFQYLEISIAFKRSATLRDETGDDPIIRALTPRKLHGYSSTRRRARRWEVEQLYWRDDGSVKSSKVPPMEVDDELNTSIIGKAWVPSRREKPHQVNWTITNEVQTGSWPILDEIELALIVEFDGAFEATVGVSAVRTSQSLARIFSLSWWSRDQPLLFNGITTKGNAPRITNFEQLNEGDWVHLAFPPKLHNDPKPPAGKKDTNYRVSGIPHGYSQEDVLTLLATACKLEIHKISICSIATNPHRRELVATVAFTESPSVLTDKDRNEWSFQHKSYVRNQMAPDMLSSSDGEEIYLSIDNHFRGFTPLHSLEGVAKHRVDIIAVSGLGGHAFGSFKQRGGSNMWLRDSLSRDIDGARILVYGHDSHLVESSSSQTISTISGQLRSSIRSIRNFENGTDPQVPLVFIGHSLGGLLIKQALISMSKGDDSDRANLNATYGALFFGTPNQGMDIESLVTMVGDQPNRYLLESLGKGSEVLKALLNNFNEVFTSRDSEIISFYETQQSNQARKVDGRWEMSGPLRMLVDIHSATQGRPWENGENFIDAINRNHSDLVKFSRNDEDYERVLAHLRRIVHRAVIEMPKRIGHQD